MARPCLGPPGGSCPTNAIVERGNRCQACARLVVYRDPRWRRLSARLLAEHRRNVGPWCPGLPPTHDAHPEFDLTCDHIIRPQDGGAPFDRANVRILCRSINSGRRPY